MLDSNSVMGLMDFVLVGAGLYMLYGYYLLMAKDEIKEGILISRMSDAKKCKDIKGFKKEMGPKVLIFALAAIASGAIGLIQDYVTKLPTQVYLVCYFAFFAAIVWFAMAAKRIEKKYF